MVQIGANDTVATEYATNERLDALDLAVDEGWLIMSGIIILAMQAGFSLLEAGSVHPKHAPVVALKNVADFAVGTLMFTLMGNGFTYGESAGGVMGTTGFLATGLEKMSLPGLWLFRLSFCATASTIVSGGVAGRMKFGVYLVVSAFMAAVVYPLVAHWVWNEDGWLYSIGFVDFAGGGPVHLVGGTGAMIGAYMIEPRIGAFMSDRSRNRQGASPVLVCLGVFILAIGWFAFNGGSSGGLAGSKHITAAKAVASTAAAIGGGGSVSLAYPYYTSPRPRRFDMYDSVTGLLGALVAVTPSCAYVRVWEGLIIGAVGAVSAMIAADTAARMWIDDPVDAFAVHGATGAVSLLLAGLFCDNSYLPDAPVSYVGVFHGGGFRLLGVQALGCFVIVSFVTVVFGGFVLFIRTAVGIRTSLQEELEGESGGMVIGDLLAGSGSIKELTAAEAERLNQKDRVRVLRYHSSLQGSASDSDNESGPRRRRGSAVSPTVRRMLEQGLGTRVPGAIDEGNEDRRGSGSRVEPERRASLSSVVEAKQADASLDA